MAQKYRVGITISSKTYCEAEMTEAQLNAYKSEIHKGNQPDVRNHVGELKIKERETEAYINSWLPIKSKTKQLSPV
jgi:hypothetical protein